MSITIEHNGQVFTAIRGKDGRLTWPIEEYLARVSLPYELAKKVAEAQPDGKVEGACPQYFIDHPEEAPW